MEWENCRQNKTSVHEIITAKNIEREMHGQVGSCFQMCAFFCMNRSIPPQFAQTTTKKKYHFSRSSSRRLSEAHANLSIIIPRATGKDSCMQALTSFIISHHHHLTSSSHKQHQHSTEFPTHLPPFTHSSPTPHNFPPYSPATPASSP